LKVNNWFNHWSPLQWALGSSVLIALVLYFVLFLVFPLSEGNFLKYYLFILFSSIFNFGAIFFILNFFLERKIKVLYKLMNLSRLSRAEHLGSMGGNVFKQIEKDIQAWLVSREQEWENREALENYRRNYIGNVSHELKTPIFNVQGFIHTLLDGALYDNDINRQYLQKAAKNIKRLETIVEDLDAISKLESGELILDIQTLDIKKLAEEVFEELELPAMGKSIQLGFKEDARNSFLVTGDRESIRQVLLNLIMNSIKYGKVGGKTRLGFYDLENKILVEVSDDGIGIGQEHLKHLFDRFYRVDKSRSRSVGGSGLGLSIVKHILEAHGQTITVRSQSAIGTTFGFTLDKK
jgi:two-component system, OmpR family, phosphate regulon sensor histidine kinase PhoR